MKDILIIEPFCGGSHEQLIQLLSGDEKIGYRCEKACLPAKKWQWRARTSSLYYSQVIPLSEDYRVLFASSVLNLAELVALRPDLSRLKKILYFHENQLIYPVRKHQDRDFQYGYNQILSSLVADVLVFNSTFNMESFLSSIPSFLKLIPDHRPKNLVAQIHPKCQVLYFPVHMNCDHNVIKTNILEKKSSCSPNTMSVHNNEPYQESVDHNCVVETEGKVCADESALQIASKESSSINCHPSGHIEHQRKKMMDENQKYSEGQLNPQLHDSQISSMALESHPMRQDMFLKWDPSTLVEDCLHIVWPHRWEHDKDPESFFAALFQLQQESCNFNVSVIGETFSAIPEVFNTARQRLGSKVKAWGFQSREDFLAILDSAHVVVSTALHEFFGVSMLEAITRNCYPLCPNRLVYPEIYPKECLYSTQAQLIKRLKRFCARPQSVNTSLCNSLAEKYSWEQLQDRYRNLLLAQT